MGKMAQVDFEKWGIWADRIRLVPYAIDPVSPLQPHAPESFPRFLFLGALCYRKGVDVLLNAMKLVHSQFPAATLSLLGRDDSNGVYIRLASSLNISTVTFFRPSVPAKGVASEFARHDVLILPSRFDGWGMVISEAASAGLALIATDRCGAAHHLIVDGESGFVVPPENAVALTEAMVRYCKEPELQIVHGAKARERFSELHPTRVARTMVQALTELVSERARRSNV